MPSPFPGMDPYLESPSLWPDVHLRLINSIAEVLLQQVRPAYFCQAEERVYLLDDEDPAREVIIPDVTITVLDAERTASRGRSEADTALVEPIPVVSLIDDEIHEPFLQIIDAKSREVITVIEVLSPANKVQHSAGMAMYQKKRGEVFLSTANWVEIDLLRAGNRIRLKGRFRESDYRMAWSRATERPREWVLPVALEQRLPILPIPLRPDHPEAKLDLQAVLNLVYERAGYDLVLDYGAAPPSPPLTDEQRTWADNVLKKARASA